jgi:hypothetical protein
MFALNWCYGKDASCINQAISGTNRCRSCTNDRPNTKPQPISMFALNMCFGKNGTCENQAITGSNRCLTCNNVKQETKPLASALDVLRKMGNNIPSYCERCNTVGMFGMKCCCDGYFMPK